MSPFRWLRRLIIPPAGPAAQQLEQYLAGLRLMEAALDAAITKAAPAIDTRPGTDHTALTECERIYARPAATRRNTRKENEQP